MGLPWEFLVVKLLRKLLAIHLERCEEAFISVYAQLFQGITTALSFTVERIKEHSLSRTGLSNQ
jgi:hypothetical protein